MSRTDPLRLLVTTRALGDGGAERVSLALARRFAERGDRVVLAVDESEPALPDELDGGPRIVELGRNHIGATIRLARLLRRFRPHVALAAISASCVKLSLARGLAATRTPLVLSFHGSEEWRTGRLAALAYHCLPLMARSADRIVAVSDGLRDLIVERWGAPAEKTVRIYNPVPLDYAAAAASARDLASRAPHLVAVGRLSPEKGMTDLVAAFARLDRPETRLTIAGDGPERARLETQAAALGVADRIVFTGRIDPEPLYRDARVAVVPSRTEAFGMVLVEALAHGLPVVATACAGPTEILDHGRHGTIVPIGDVAAMAAAIGRALDAPGDPQARIERAAPFAMEARFAEWAALVDEIAAAHARR